MTKKVITGLTSLVLILSLCFLSGCSTKMSVPKDASSMMTQYMDNMKTIENYHIDAIGDFTVDVGYIQGEDEEATIKASIPVNMTISSDLTTSKEAIHSKIGLKADLTEISDMFGGDWGSVEKTDIESYIEKEGNKYVAYYSYDNNDKWNKIESDKKDEDADINNTIQTLDSIIKNEDILKGSSFEETKNKYIVDIPFDLILHDSEFYKTYNEFMENNGYYDLAEDFGVSPKDILKQLEKAHIDLTFDKDTRLLDSLKVKDLSCATMLDNSSYKIGISLSSNIDLAINKYNKIDSDLIKVPDDIKNSALEDS